LPPALLQDGTDLPTIATRPTLILAGEAPGAALFRSLASDAQLVNGYGPTETTVCATAWRCPDDFAASTVPIGRPFGNARVYLLDAYGQPVPQGVTGELYIGGAGLARGYLNRLELTAARFVRDPFSEEPDARMYRSGDLARYLPDGNLVFAGRDDDQIKIRGFRVELGEIEAQLAMLDGVSKVAVVVREDTPGDQRLWNRRRNTSRTTPSTTRSTPLPQSMQHCCASTHRACCRATWSRPPTSRSTACR
jgi:non-ribosomal peptide synthetase component F